jgi:hypothetical protein
MFFIFDIIIRIYKGNFREGLMFSWAPYLLPREKYWHYLSDEQGSHASLAKWSLVTVLILFVGAAYLFYRYGVTYWTIGIFVVLLFLAVFGVVYALATTSSRMWWYSLVLFAGASIFLSFFLIPLFGTGLLTLYLSVSHLISLIRGKEIIHKL